MARPRYAPSPPCCVRPAGIRRCFVWCHWCVRLFGPVRWVLHCPRLGYVCVCLCFWSAGTACWLARAVARVNSGLTTCSRQLSQARPRTATRVARHSLFGRYMKAQPRLAGGRRKLGRNGSSSDIPRECVDPPEYLRDLRDLSRRGAQWSKIVVVANLPHRYRLRVGEQPSHRLAHRLAIARHDE